MVKEKEITEIVWKKEVNNELWRVIAIKGNRNYAVGYEERFKELYKQDKLFFLSYTKNKNKIEETTSYLPFPHEMQQIMLKSVLDIVVKPNIRNRDIQKFQTILDKQKEKTEEILIERKKINNIIKKQVKPMENQKTYEELKEEVKKLLLYTKRKGIEQLIHFLEKTDYYTAPASSKYHLNIFGGLLQHHYNVYSVLLAKNKKFKLNIREDTIIITGLLHDLAKVGLYRKAGHEYIINKSVLERGHAKLSIERIKKFIILTDEEEQMIKYHMGTFGMIGSGYIEEYTAEEMHEAIKKYPSVQIFASSDMESSIMEKSLEEKEKELLDTNNDNIIKVIDKKDKGQGVTYYDITSEFKNPEKTQELIIKMITYGEVFEIRKGMIKVLR